MFFLIKHSHFQEYRQKNFEKSIVIEKKTLPLQSIWRFRSSVGLEQQPSKLWVLGSNPNGITLCPHAGHIGTKQRQRGFYFGSILFVAYIQLVTSE